MQQTIVEVKRLPSAQGLPLPKYQTAGAAGMDLVAVQDQAIGEGATSVVPTGLVVALQEGYELQVRSRGGLASKGIFVTNGPGTVDSDYRGEIMVLLTNMSGRIFNIKRGDRIAQAVLAPVIQAKWLEVVDGELSTTDRGDGRFSSTGLR